VKFFEVRFRPGQHPVVLHSLPIPQVTGSASVTGLALSPDGSRLAVAINTGEIPAPATQLNVYTLATGAVREWRSPGWIGSRRFDSGSVSWANDGTLAVNWSDYIHGNHSPLHSNKGTGVYLLDTASRGGSLLGSSRFVLHTGQDGGIQAGDNAMLIPDGTKLVAIEGDLPGAARRSRSSPPAPASESPLSTVAPTPLATWSI
jgi:hypothetical protein